MTAPATPIPYLSKDTQAGFLQFRQTCLDAFTAFQDFRFGLINIDRAYMREYDFTTEQWKAKLANRNGDTNKFQNITIPIVLPTVEAAVEYQTEVFLTGYPVFSCVGPPDQWDAVEMMNVIMEENSTRGGWVQELMKFFRDGFKYNIMAIEADWGQCVTPVLETNLSKSTKYGVPKEVVWSGNVVKRIDPYNMFWDKRYSPSEVCTRGEYAGYHSLYSRTEFKTFLNELDCKILSNVVPALESAAQAWGIVQDTVQGYSIPQIRQDLTTVMQSGSGEPDWMSWVGPAGGNTQIKYKNSYIVTTIYARIIPEDFAIRTAAPATPQIWKLYFVNQQVLIGAKRMTNAHNYLPILMGQPLDDGLSYQTKSLAENVQDVQDVSSALMNSVIAARRRAISDRTLYDPSKVATKDINSDNPSAKIPVRPSAYGKPVGEAVYAFPFRDDQSGIILGEMQQIMQLADLTSGQNRARRGQFQKGNKTLHEYQDVQDNSTGRDRMTSIGIETSVLTPLKYILKTNILQYQGVNQIFSATLQKNVNVDPVKLRNAALAFNVSDGLLPSSKLLNTDAVQSGFQTLAQVPQLAAGYNLPPLFSYLMKANNADLTPFEKGPAQIAYENAVSQYQQNLQLIIEKGGDPKSLGAAPLPQQFNYDPSVGPAPTPTNAAAEPQTVQTNYRVNSNQTPASGPSGNSSSQPIKT